MELWYPCDGTELTERYSDRFTHAAVDYDIRGRAIRDAVPSSRAPLVVVAHGNPGSRFLLAWLTEHLASHGLAVAAIDHLGAGHGDSGYFPDVMMHHPLDVAAVVDAARGWDAVDPASECILIGYSMGGYGVLAAAGVGVRPEAVDDERASPGRRLAGREAGRWSAIVRPRAVVALAPFGYPSLYDRAGLAGIRTELLVVGGTDDQTSGYSPGVRDIFEHAAGCDRSLVTLDHAGHSLGSHPPPDGTPAEAYSHFADRVWDPRRVADVIRHAAVGWLRSTPRDPAWASGLDAYPGVTVEHRAADDASR